MPRSNNSGGSNHRSSQNSSTLLFIAAGAVVLMFALHMNDRGSVEPAPWIDIANHQQRDQRNGVTTTSALSDSRLGRMSADAKRAMEAAQNATSKGHSGYADGLMRRAEHAQDQLIMAQIENQLENSVAALKELQMKYPDNEKVEYAADVMKIAEDAAEDALDPRQTEPTPLASKWHQPSPLNMIIVALVFIAIGFLMAAHFEGQHTPAAAEAGMSEMEAAAMAALNAEMAAAAVAAEEQAATAALNAETAAAAAAAAGEETAPAAGM